MSRTAGSYQQSMRWLSILYAPGPVTLTRCTRSPPQHEQVPAQASGSVKKKEEFFVFGLRRRDVRAVENISLKRRTAKNCGHPSGCRGTHATAAAVHYCVTQRSLFLLVCGRRGRREVDRVLHTRRRAHIPHQRIHMHASNLSFRRSLIVCPVVDDEGQADRYFTTHFRRSHIHPQ